VEIDAAVVSVLLIVKAHPGLLGMGRPEPASLRFGLRVKFHIEDKEHLDPIQPLGQAPAHPNEAAMSTQALHVTAAVLRFFEVQRLTGCRGR
jgi:hypothetical protein